MANSKKVEKSATLGLFGGLEPPGTFRPPGTPVHQWKLLQTLYRILNFDSSKMFLLQESLVLIW